MENCKVKDNYSITLTDTNNTLADINFSASGITVSRSGNQYTFTSKNMISNAVLISAQKKTTLNMGKMLIWGCPGKQTMASGAEDPVFFYSKTHLCDSPLRSWRQSEGHSGYSRSCGCFNDDEHLCGRNE